MRKLLFILAAFVAAGVGTSAWVLLSRPGSAQTRVQISKIGVTASPDSFFALVEDFRSWRRWSPRERDDPDVRRTYGGGAKGKGAVYAWEAGAAGSGRAEIVETSFPGRVVVAVDLARPVAGHLELVFTFERNAGGTTIAVAAGGPSGLVRAVMDMFFRASLSRLSCAAGRENAGLCKVMMRGIGDGAVR